VSSLSNTSERQKSLEHTKRSKEKDSNEIETIDPALIIESAMFIWVVFERESG
jgi:hypothetical protein